VLKQRGAPQGLQPLPPMKKWRAITLATLLLVPGYWSMLAGLVAASTKDAAVPINTAAAVALGLALLPFVFVVLAFLSEHPRAPAAVLRAMGLALLVGIPVSAIAGDAVTGLVAGVGAGGIVALRTDPAHSWRARAVAVLIASLYAFILVRVAGGLALLPAPVLPLTGIGVADHLSERRWERETLEPEDTTARELPL
jgi:hypothetical protein